ncbi:MAG TPA: flagellar biosynthetic protein FliR [Acidobacteriaceae bacterium]
MIDIPLLQVMLALLTIGVRVSGLMLFAPFLGSTVIPARIKAVLTLALTFLLYPMVEHSIPAIAVGEWPGMVASELLVGLALGIVTSLVFDAVQMAGQVLSIQMGYSLINILDPNTQVESTVVATFHQALVMLIFLRLDVHLWLLRALGNSFAYLPPGSAHLTRPFAVTALGAGASVIQVGVQVAAPVLSATLLADLVLGLLGKASPQLPLMLLGPAVKSLLGLLVLMAALKYWPDMFRGLFLRSIAATEQLLHLAR